MLVCACFSNRSDTYGFSFEQTLVKSLFVLIKHKCPIVYLLSIK